MPSYSHHDDPESSDLRGWGSFKHLARELKLARLARIAYPYRRRSALSIAAMIIVTVSGLATPYLVAIAIDSGIRKGSLRVIDEVIVAFLAINLVNLGASYVQTYLVSWVGEHVVLDLRRNLFAHLQKLSLDFFSRQKTGWIVSRLTNDIDALDELVTDGVTSLVTNGLTLVGAAIFLFVLDWRLASATLAILPLLIVATLAYRTRSSRSYALVRNRIGDVNAHLQESISGMRALKAFRRESRDYEQLVRVNAAYRDVNMQTVWQSGLYFPFVEFLAAVGTMIVLWYGGTLVTENAVQVGVLVAYIGYLNSFFDPIQQLSQLYNTFQASMAAVKKIFTVLDIEPDLRDAPGAIVLPNVRGEVGFNHVDFAYGDGPAVLHDIDFTIPAGHTVALIGTTGAGKSTIIKLLARFYDPVAGSVTVDGHDLRAVTTRSLREQLAVVPQEAFLFSGSILDNIRFAKPSASLDEVQHVARMVGVHEFVESLRNGYETDVQEGGSGLSTGQRQLVSFARALLANPRILILDEATSSVDAASEQRIEQALRALLSGRTAVIVAHRLSTIRHADTIVVIEAGRVHEQGSHEDLLLANGRYADLYRQWERTGQTV